MELPRKKFHLKIMSEEMAQWLGALVARAKNPSLVSSTHMAANNHQKDQCSLLTSMGIAYAWCTI